MRNTKLNIISLFSGAGGLDLAACTTGNVQKILSTDSNATFLETTRINLFRHFPTVRHKSFVADAFELKGQELLDMLGTKPDLIMGGPPCDDFTTSGLRRGMNGRKGGLLHEFSRLLGETRPLCFLFENVPNLARQFRKSFDAFLSEISELGYRVSWNFLKACDYGAPTIRQRIIAVGWRNDVQISQFCYPKPTHGHCEKDRLLSDLLKPYVKISDVLAGLPDRDLNGNSEFLNHTGRRHYEKTVCHMKTVQPGKYVNQSRRYRAPWDGLCRSLNAGMDNGTKSYLHPIYHREMSVREYARIHCFPDTWLFCGTHHNGIKQVANAVPIPLGIAVLTTIRDHFNQSTKENR